jgi:phosphoribosylpyrophosphate synthetase
MIRLAGTAKRSFIFPGSIHEAMGHYSKMDELVVTDTIPLSEAAQACEKIRQLSIAQMLAETIRRMAHGESVSSMYVD